VSHDGSAHGSVGDAVEGDDLVDAAPDIRERMDRVLADEPEDVREAYLRARTKEHRGQLDAIVAELLDDHGLRLRFEKVLHPDDNDALRQRLASSA
jgi:hypothetical protein